MKGDFLGFSFDGIHSSLLGIVRVSDGDRYDDMILSDFEDKRNPVSGRDGEYYFGSDYKAKEIKISIAFDSVTEKQLRLITNLFSTKKLCPLIFDERPYKMYMAKINTPIELSYICFDERKKVIDDPRDGIRANRYTTTETIIDEETGEEKEVEIFNYEKEKIYPYKYLDETERIYKGEGNIEFVCMNPFAAAPFKILDLYSHPEDFGDKDLFDSYFGTKVRNKNLLTKYTNVNEWAQASNILTKEKFDELMIDKPTRIDSNGLTMNINVYNPGDIDSPFYLYLPYDSDHELKGNNTDDFYIRLEDEAMVFKKITRRSSAETGILINTSNQLIEGITYLSGDSIWRTSGQVYNDCLISGYFPKIAHMGVRELITNQDNLIKQTIKSNCHLDLKPDEDIDRINEVRLFYNYLYY